MSVNLWHNPFRHLRPEDLDIVIVTAPGARRDWRGNRTARETAVWIVSLIELIVDAHSSAYTAEGTDRSLDAFK